MTKRLRDAAENTLIAAAMLGGVAAIIGILCWTIWVDGNDVPDRLGNSAWAMAGLSVLVLLASICLRLLARRMEDRR